MRGDFETRLIPLSRLESNRGQVEGLPKNPRVIKDAKFEKLKKSILENPEMLALRELLVWQDEALANRGRYLIIGGNMRFRAMTDAGFKEAPCKVIPMDTPLDTLRAYVIKDNGEFGRWDFDALANEWDMGELDDYGIDMSAWSVGEQDFEDANQEIDTEDFSEMMSLKLAYTEEEFAVVAASLDAIDPESREKALLKVTGWEE